MNKKNILSLLVFIGLSVSLYGQAHYEIKPYSEKEFNKYCRESYDFITNKAEEIAIGVNKDDAGSLFLSVTNKEWFEQLLNKYVDAITIEIVSREQYNCSTGKPSAKSQSRGFLLKTVTHKELKQKIVGTNNGGVYVKIGTLPPKFKGKDIEFNVIFLNENFICCRYTTFNLEAYRWDLLDMGFYFDTLTYKTALDTALTEQESTILFNKIMRFEIPFEKNKSIYSAEDIKPMYDSLNLTDFNIKKITIRAYSSVEGNEERNSELQQERAQSIVNALQSYQNPAISTEITVSENWVDFLNDIIFTQYRGLASQSKYEIRNALKDKETARDLEPYLQKHRKAVIILELEKKSRYRSTSINKLIELFTESISQKNLKQAIEIQNSLFERVKNHEIPSFYLNRIEIPEKSDYSILLTRNSIFKYLMNETSVLEAYRELEALDDLIPDDGHINYNICAMKFKVWLLGSMAIDAGQFKNEINDLKKWGINDMLIKRMLINYEIIMCELYMRQGEFDKKDKSLSFIYSNYFDVPLTDTDYLSLSQYFSSYSKYEWATQLLEKRVRNVNVNEDLLFYYLNLTISVLEKTKDQGYRIIMLNALNINPERFCRMFECSWKGGVSFQLLDNEYLKNTYCENCAKKQLTQ